MKHSPLSKRLALALALACVLPLVIGCGGETGGKEELALFVKKSLKNYFYKKTKQSPLIVVSVLEV